MVTLFSDMWGHIIIYFRGWAVPLVNLIGEAIRKLTPH